MPEEHEDVDTTLEQSTTPDTSQQKEKSRAIGGIVGVTFGCVLLLIIWWGIAQVIGWNPDVSSEHFAQFYFAWGLGILSLGYLVLILWSIFKKDEDPRWFHARILSSGIVGGSYAFLLPAVMSLPEGGVNSGGAAALRQAILLATGGLIGLIALGETRRKNDNDREAAENLRIHQQDTLDQQKDQFEKQLEKQQEQFDANAFKDRKAERRERYTKAVEQLGDEKAPVRMGGVYTLVGLVDEWLEEESIRKYEDRLKEGQVIINNLCAYIRSPFTLASHYDELMQDTPGAEGVYQDKVQEFYADKATLDSEADVRLSIIKEIHDRIQGPDKNTPGAWSDFEYDFSGSTFFYPIDLTNSYYAKPINFSGSTYKGRAYFTGSTYKGWANFNDSTYQSGANFSHSIYQSGANFSHSIYQSGANFSHSTYQSGANFSHSTYQSGANFNDSTYQSGANFSHSTYQSRANFSHSTYQSRANFSHSTYQSGANFNDSTYQSRANFNDSTYQSRANFNDSTYQSRANFSDSTYQSRADFSDSTYQSRADFSGSIFCSDVYFGTYIFNDPSRFTKYAPIFYDETYHQKTLFGSTNNDFTVDTDEGYPIILNSEGLPLGCEFLTSEQKEYLKDKFQEIDETKNKFLEVKDPKEKAELSKNLQALNEELHDWCKEATTVKVEGTAPEEEDN
ncbi:hypothetical protein [Rothia sp. HSID18069]|uniref:hypothetical protein n=1 Tax=Rothia sp. HSID18069 TaxID=2419515 RepID=UPI001EE8099B|nr:hypothetical protein [Rothia sp. HSID18069]